MWEVETQSAFDNLRDCFSFALTQIRAEFEKLLSENAAKPEAERLPRSHFEIDPGLKEMME